MTGKCPDVELCYVFSCQIILNRNIVTIELTQPLLVGICGLFIVWMADIFGYGGHTSIDT